MMCILLFNPQKALAVFEARMLKSKHPTLDEPVTPFKSLAIYRSCR